MRRRLRPSTLQPTLPVVGWILLLVWYCTRGASGPNRFGAGQLPAEGQPCLQIATCAIRRMQATGREMAAADQ
ncbi:MAG: hypothetical protein ACREEU_01150 [Acetobacteraceae bacterium]